MEWLKSSHPDIYNKLYSEDALKEKIAQLKVDDKVAERIAKDTAKIEKEANKQDARMAREEEKKLASKVYIKRVTRNKRKHITHVNGLEVFGIDLKKVAKQLANHFACGGSVSKNPQGLDEIVVQGDFSQEIRDIIVKKYPQVPPQNIELIEDKKEKKKQ
ncbi:Translation machinery-associated protein 22 [Mycoemilia scoparia]|uniref:Translation machinery-associated protein 22 n=1 Tax=Mycoemilia scoparia TaxID=417184 RepID=A0A9W8A706_9FUNG|nr:Translation machinery-associated protein 22 [Mycoemilia scoparia]